MRSFLICFVPLFVAVDALGVLPVFMGLTAGLEPVRIRRLILQSVVTAMIVAAAFVAIGKLIFRLLGITVSDFMIAGGALLFVISLRDLLASEGRHRPVNANSVGIVPLGVPLIVGPAVLTTLLLLLDEHGTVPTVAAAVANIGLAGIVLAAAPAVHRVLGSAGTKALSKLANLLLAAIAVMMMRKGLVALLSHG